MKTNDLIAFFIEEAQHHVINDERTKTAESALAAYSKKAGKGRSGQGKKLNEKSSDVTCGNCKKPGHVDADCYAKGGGKEGQAPWQKNKSANTESAIVAVDDDDNKLFAFTCTSDYATVAKDLDIPKSKLGACVDSGASC